MKVVLGERELYIDFHRKKRKGSVETVCKIYEGRGEQAKVITEGRSKNFAGGDVSQDSDIERILPKDPFDKEVGRRKSLHRALLGDDAITSKQKKATEEPKFNREERVSIVKQYEEFIVKSKIAGEYRGPKKVAMI